MGVGRKWLEMKVVIVNIASISEMIVPIHAQVIDDEGHPLDLRSPGKKPGKFWTHFRACAFSKRALVSALRRLVGSVEADRLLEQAIDYRLLPEENPTNILLQLQRQFEEPHFELCMDSECSGFRHVHLFHRGKRVSPALHSESAVRAWLEHTDSPVPAPPRAAHSYYLPPTSLVDASSSMSR